MFIAGLSTGLILGIGGMLIYASAVGRAQYRAQMAKHTNGPKSGLSHYLDG